LKSKSFFTTDTEDTEEDSYFWRIGFSPILQKLLRLSAGKPFHKADGFLPVGFLSTGKKTLLCDLSVSVVNPEFRFFKVIGIIL